MPKAVVCRRFGPPEALSVEDLPSSRAPGAKEAVVRVLTSGVDWTQNLMIENRYQRKPALPFSPGGEVTGVVADVGAAATGLRRGDLVYVGIGVGGFAEEICVKASACRRLAPATDLTTFPSMYGYITALFALRNRAKLQKGETLLVLAAAGGVGITAVELGKLWGARVIAAASSDEKLAACRAQGADVCLNYSAGPAAFRKALKQAAPRGVDVVYDPVGDAWADAVVRHMRWGGRYLIIGFAAGDIPALRTNLLLNTCSSAVGCPLGFWQMKYPAEYRAAVEEIIQLHADGKIRPVSGTHMYPLEEGPRALRDLLNRKITGKALVTTPAFAEWAAARRGGAKL